MTHYLYIEENEREQTYLLKGASVALDNWSNKTIGELCNFSNGYGFRPPDWSKEGLPIIRIQNLNGSKEFNYFNGIPDDSWLVEPGTILFAWAGTRGVSFGPNIWSGPRGVLNQHIYRIHPRKEVNPLWLYVALEFATKNIEKNAHGFKATLLHVRKEEITSQVVHCPPLFEQKKIVTILADIDALITSLDRLIAKKRDIKQATMQQLLTGKTRLPGFSENWEVKKLGDVIETILGGGTPSRSEPEYWDGNIPWVTVKDFATFDPHSTQERITEFGLQNSSSNLIKKGIIIISTRMAVGKAIIYEVDVSINQDLKAIFLKKDINILYMFYWFEKNTKSIGDLGSGSTVKGISLSDLKNISFFKPPTINEQQAIATILTDMDAEIAALEQRRDKTRAIKQGMMQELLTGKTRLL